MKKNIWRKMKKESEKIIDEMTVNGIRSICFTEKKNGLSIAFLDLERIFLDADLSGEYSDLIGMMEKRNLRSVTAGKKKSRLVYEDGSKLYLLKDRYGSYMFSEEDYDDDWSFYYPLAGIHLAEACRMVDDLLYGARSVQPHRKGEDSSER